VAICDPRDFIWRNLNLQVLGMFHAKYCQIWCSSSWEDFIKAFPYILLCKSLNPWSGAIHDSLDFIWTKLNLLVPRMLHAKHQWILDLWDEDFWRFIKTVLILPLNGVLKEASPFIWIPIPQACFLPTLVEIGQWFLRRSCLKQKLMRDGWLTMEDRWRAMA